MEVWMILFPLFAGVAIYLFVHGQRRHKLMETFAESRGFTIDRTREKDLETRLRDTFALSEPNLGRAFGSLASIVVAGDMLIFRTVEALDLSIYGKAMNTHHSRICALFPVSSRYKEFFLLLPDGSYHKQIPSRGEPTAEIVQAVRNAAGPCGAKHVVSTTLEAGWGLIYFEPTAVGSEGLADIDALYCMASTLSTGLGEDLAA